MSKKQEQKETTTTEMRKLRGARGWTGFPADRTDLQNSGGDRLNLSPLTKYNAGRCEPLVAWAPVYECSHSITLHPGRTVLISRGRTDLPGSCSGKKHTKETHRTEAHRFEMLKVEEETKETNDAD